MDISWDTRSISTTDEAELAVWTAGPDEGEVVLLLHGFSLDHATWAAVASLLVDGGLRVIVPDLRGHGRSSLGSSPPTVERLVGDVKEVMEAFDVPQVHLVGHSLGAVVVLAARSDHRLADAIKTATSVAGTERAVQNPIMKLGARLFSSSLGVSLLRREWTGRAMISTWFGEKRTPEGLDWIRELSAACERATRSAVAAATRDVDLRPTFSVSGAPTLVMSGQRDRATPAKISKRIASAIDGAELRIVGGAGHMVIIEEHEIVAGHVAEWIDRHA